MPTWEEDFQRLLPISKGGVLQPVTDELGARSVVLSSAPAAIAELQAAASAPAGTGLNHVLRAYDEFMNSYLPLARDARRPRIAPEQVASGFARGLEAIALEAARHGDLSHARELFMRGARALDLATSEVPGLASTRLVGAKERETIKANQERSAVERISRCSATLGDPAMSLEQRLIAAEAMSLSFSRWKELGADQLQRRHRLASVQQVIQASIAFGGEATRHHAIEMLTRTTTQDFAGKESTGIAPFLYSTDPEIGWTRSAQLVFVAQCHRSSANIALNVGASSKAELDNRLWTAYVTLHVLPESNAQYPVALLASEIIRTEPSGGPMSVELGAQADELCARIERTPSLLGLDQGRADQLVASLRGLRHDSQVMLGVTACALNAQFDALVAADQAGAVADRAQWEFQAGRLTHQLADDLRSELTQADQAALRAAGRALVAGARSFYDGVANTEMTQYCEWWVQRSVDLARS